MNTTVNNADVVNNAATAASLPPCGGVASSTACHFPDDYNGSAMDDTTGGSGLPTASSTWTVGYDAAVVIGVLVAAVGLALDAFTFAALTRLRLSFPSMRVVLASLCLADCLLALTTLALLSIDHLGSRQMWPAGTDSSQAAAVAAAAARRISCAAETLRWLWDAATNAHLLTLLALASQQFISVRWPLQSDGWLSARSSAVALAAAWIAACVPPAARAALIATAVANDPAVDQWPEKGTTRFCYQVIRYTHGDHLTGAYSLDYGQLDHEQATAHAELAIKSAVLLAICASYGYVFATVHRLHEHGSAAAAAAAEMSDSSGGQNTGSGGQWVRRRRSDRRRGERRVLITAFVVTLLYLACYLPLFCYNMVRIYSGYKYQWSAATGPALLTVVCMTTVLDPVVYAFRLTELRAGVRRALFRRLGIAGGRRPNGDGPLLHADGSARAAMAAALLRLCCIGGQDDCCHLRGVAGVGTVSPRTQSASTLSTHVYIDSSRTGTHTVLVANGKGEAVAASPAHSQLGAAEPDATDSLIQNGGTY